jgi:hypothetical protein
MDALDTRRIALFISYAPSIAHISEVRCLKQRLLNFNGEIGVAFVANYTGRQNMICIAEGFRDDVLNRT